MHAGNKAARPRLLYCSKAAVMHLATAAPTSQLLHTALGWPPALPQRPLLFVIADAGLPPDAPSADTMMVFFATPSSTDRTLVAKLMEHSVSPDAAA